MKKITKTTAVLLALALLLAAGCAKPEDDILPEAAWVDLGLPSGLLWAACNVGANFPEEYGDYFAWGETQPKETYDQYTYRFYNEEFWLTKYCSDPAYGGESGFTDTLTILQPSDDAATANLAHARTPTCAEWEELISHTTSEWDTLNGVAGRRLTGPNGNSIFLPAADACRTSGPPPTRVGRTGLYWTSTLKPVYIRSAMEVCFSSKQEPQILGGLRQHGMTVRAVRSAL